MFHFIGEKSIKTEENINIKTGKTGKFIKRNSMNNTRTSESKRIEYEKKETQKFLKN